MDDLAEENKNNQNWIGKEKDNENGLGDHGVRKYEYETDRFTSIDPMWNNYFGWTPYQYSMNSPIGLIDEGGFKVKALDALSREAIKRSIEGDYEDYVKFNKEGYVIAESLRVALPADIDKNSNAATLLRLAEHEQTAIVKVGKNTTFKDKDGNILTREFYTDEYIEGKTYFWGAGITFVPDGPDADNAGMYSIDNNSYIYINPNRNYTGRPYFEISAHELFYHFRFYLMNLQNGHDPETGEVPDGYQKWIDMYENQSHD